MIYKYLILATIFIANVSLAFSQVTIGNNEPPAEGALLQLKTDQNITDGSKNSTKGLGLPRVNLTDINNLYPMFTDNGAGGYKIGSTSYTKADENKKHIGLWVYNMNQCLTEEGYENGLYVWDGEQWQWINKNVYPDITYFVDDRDIANPQTYASRDFGVAGIWMIENLRATTYANGTSIAPTLGNQTTSGTGTGVQHYVREYFYPNNDATLLSKHSEYGLSYTWYAAVNYTIGATTDTYTNEKGNIVTKPIGISIDQTNDSSQPQIQGICPNGWHVPSDYEWTQLEKVFAANPKLYSSTTTVTPWNSVWDTRNGASGNYATQMKAICPVSYATLNPDGTSFPSGFNVRLTGNYAKSNYGKNAYYWTSSIVSYDYINLYDIVRFRLFTSLDSGVVAGGHMNLFGFYVRCKKN